MRRYTLHIQKDADQTCRAAAEFIAGLTENRLAERSSFSFVLAGGETPKSLYEMLAKPPFRDRIDWPRVDFFWGDERPVPPNHPESNYRLASETLLAPLAIGRERIHRIHAEQADRESAARDYQNEIARVLGAPPLGEPPSFDLVLLGMGEDAHTASLFPATKALLETQQWVTVNRVLKLDSERFTMTPMILNRARHILFLVTGDRKASAVAEVIQSRIDTQRLPAQLIKPSGGKVYWFVDEAAAAKLSEKTRGAETK